MHLCEQRGDGRKWTASLGLTRWMNKALVAPFQHPMDSIHIRYIRYIRRVQLWGLKHLVAKAYFLPGQKTLKCLGLCPTLIFRSLSSVAQRSDAAELFVVVNRLGLQMTKVLSLLTRIIGENLQVALENLC